MTVTVLVILAFLALICACLSASGKCPLWVSVVLLAIYALVQQIPTGR